MAVCNRESAGRAGSEEFYRLLAGLAGGARRLQDCRPGDCPGGGVYFFFEDGEVRNDGSSRVVRVGTHAPTAASSATLWDRLRQHRGHTGGRDPGSGNHRHHHRCKQAEGWWLEQPEPGVMVWHTPVGRTYTTTPTRYAA
jgi:hypothetical protein